MFKLSRGAPNDAQDARDLELISHSHLILRLDGDNIIRAANAVFCEVTGHTAEAVIGKPFHDLLRPQDRAAPWLSEVFDPISRGEESYRVTPLLSAGGEELWLSATYIPTGSSGKKEIVVIARDITKFHLMRRDNRGQVDAVKRSMAVIEFDLEGNILAANDLFLTTVGYTLDEVVGKHHRIFMPKGEDRTPAYAAFWKRLGEGGSENGQVRRVGKSGDDIWLEATYETVSDPDGRPFKVVKYAFDVTKAKNIEADSLSQIDAIQKVQAVIEFTPDGVILRANDLFCNALGYREDEIVGQHHRIFLSEEAAAAADYATFWRDLSEGRAKDGDFIRVSKDGREVFIRASYNPIRNASGKVVKIVKFAIDTTVFQTTAKVMREGLGRLSAGDLEVRLYTELGELDAIRADFNTSVGKIHDVIRSVSDRSTEVASSTEAVSGAVRQLAQRTERQAATLEESAAALNELAASVVHSAEDASEARKKATIVIEDTARSSATMKDAMSAMDAIEESSKQISAISVMIDDIAFQTNLLALNAGVEAARAGSAGRGFAVVASEVRALAQRTSEASREISELVEASGAHVTKGVGLVKETGGQLKSIDVQINEISQGVERIALAASEQSNALQELNSAVSDLEGATQSNAAMAEETTASIVALDELMQDVRQELSYFTVENAAPGEQEAEWLKVAN